MYNYNANLIKWACEEVDKQGESAVSVPGFLRGWNYIHTAPHPVEQAISILNGIVRGWPDSHESQQYAAVEAYRKTVEAYRKTPVTFVNGNTGAKADQIPRLMNQLCDSDLWDTDREAFVLEFLKIHPFEDGNGRVAAILINTPSDPHRRKFVPVPSMDGWDEGYGSQVELIDFEDDEHGCGRPVITMENV